MRISEILAPAGRPQVWMPPPPQILGAASLDDTDRQIIDALRDAGPVKTWSLLNYLTEGEGARSRADGRQARRSLWDRVRRLKRLRLLFAYGRNQLVATKPAKPPTRRPSRKGGPGVAASARSEAVSAGNSLDNVLSPKFDYPAQANLVDDKTTAVNPPSLVKKSKSAVGFEVARTAAAALARLPRKNKRRWLGWLTDKIRAYRNMAIELPGGQRAYAFGVRRRQAVYTLEVDGFVGDPYTAGVTWGVISARLVRVPKNKHAVALGRLKRGVREQKSEAKIRAARANGRAPVRHGRRPRGRPRALQPSTASFPANGPRVVRDA